MFNNVLTDAQNGFRKNKSTGTASQTFLKVCGMP
jgi:hypothetical protein